jgi:hypothetical protein
MEELMGEKGSKLFTPAQQQEEAKNLWRRYADLWKPPVAKEVDPTEALLADLMNKRAVKSMGTTAPTAAAPTAAPSPATPTYPNPNPKRFPNAVWDASYGVWTVMSNGRPMAVNP